MTIKNKTIFPEIATIFIIVVCSAFITNELRADKLPLVPHYVTDSFCCKISLNDFHRKALRDFDGLIFDARPHSLYKETHMREAKNFPVSEFNFFYQFYLTGVPHDTPIFVYGRTLSNAYDLELAYRLYIKGYKNITVLF